MHHFKAPGFVIQNDFVANVWGEFTRYVEVGDDRYVTRQIEIFDNGRVLRYDRDHWCDDFGMLICCLFSRKPKWAKFFPGAEVLSAVEFEKVWRKVLRSTFWEDQIARSRSKQWGDCPSFVNRVV